MKELSMKLTFVGCLQVTRSSMSQEFVLETLCRTYHIFTVKPVLTCDRRKSKTLRDLALTLTKSSLPSSCRHYCLNCELIKNLQR